MRTMRTYRLFFVLSLIAAIASGMIAHHFAFSGVNAESRGNGQEVRVAARSLTDGRVEVAVQQHLGGEWGEIILPRHRFLTADTEPGRWLSSSAIVLEATQSAVDDADLTASEPEPLFCIIAHGASDDHFWRLVRGYAALSAGNIGADIRFAASAEGSEQAAAIDQCSADGASVIASTLADPEAVADSLRAAKSAGSRIITFNSGADIAAAVGSELHIALDDVAAGRLAAEQFNALELSGTVVCLVHEAHNVGLEQRCEALAANYQGGDVTVLRLPVGAHPAVLQAAIAERLLDADAPAVAGMLALNGDTLVVALKAVAETAEQTVLVGSIGQTLETSTVPREVRQTHRRFVVTDAGDTQGYLITSALHMIHNHIAPPEFILQPAIMLAQPFVLNLTQVQASRDVVMQVNRNILELLANGQAWAER